MSLGATKKIGVVLMVCVFLVSVFGEAVVVKANNSTDPASVKEIEERILQTKKLQADTIAQIRGIESRIKVLNSSNASLSQQLIDLESQAKQLDSQIDELNRQIQKQEDELAKLEKLLSDMQSGVRSKVNYMYKLSFVQPHSVFYAGKDREAFFDRSLEASYALDLYSSEVKKYYQSIEFVKNARSQSQKDKQTVEALKQSLADKIHAVRANISRNQKEVDSALRSKSSLEAKLNDLSGQLMFLDAARKKMLEQEEKKIASKKQVSREPLQKGQYYFEGRGRDKVEGHGIGLSQWGAYGMAQKGWKYDQILLFYYPGTTVTDYPELKRVKVPGKENYYPLEAKQRGYLTIDEYLAGLGEVPDSWPNEAVKAQIVAARSYLMHSCRGKEECSICGTDVCQVYKGGLQKMTAVLETKGKVVAYNGIPIKAFYSASHRGCSSKISTVWGGADLPYIKEVRDEGLAFKNYWSSDPYGLSDRIYPYDWKWRTNGYSLEQLGLVFRRDHRLDVGDLMDIRVERDICGRVSQVVIVGSLGTKRLTGWDFRAIFNYVTPFNDYLYSTEFEFRQFKE